MTLIFWFSDADHHFSMLESVRPASAWVCYSAPSSLSTRDRCPEGWGDIPRPWGRLCGAVKKMLFDSFKVGEFLYVSMIVYVSPSQICWILRASGKLWSPSEYRSDGSVELRHFSWSSCWFSLTCSYLHWFPQCEAPKISKLVYNSNNYMVYGI